MRPLAWLLGLALPACAGTGASGLPHPALTDVEHLERSASPNTALAAPAGFAPAPDIVTPLFAVAASTLYAAIRTVAAAQERTYLAAEYPNERQVHYVV